MADYYPLIARAVEGLADPSPEMREAVYGRARVALSAQLNSLDPPLSEADIRQEIASLNQAIDRIEAKHQAQPSFVDFSKILEDLPSSSPEPVQVDDLGIKTSHEEQANARPRVDAPLPQSQGSHHRTVLLGSILGLVVAAIAIAAWLLRDRPEQLTANPPASSVPAPSPQEASKFNERVGGAATTNPVQPQQNVAVAQRAVFYEEDAANPQTPKAITGRVVWRVESVAAGQGQPLETAVRAIVEMPDAGLTMNMLIRRNLDTTLPASHTVELSFTTRPGDPGRLIRDVGLLQFKGEEAARGTPVAGLPVPVSANLFLIGLSNLASDIERNTSLFLRQNWIDLPVRMASGQRAILSFEKGTTGEQLLMDAFRQWQ